MNKEGTTHGDGERVETRLHQWFYGTVLCTRYTATNLSKLLFYRFGVISHSSGVMNQALSAHDAVMTIRQHFDDYKRYSGLERFYGTVAEIGPGDNCGVGLLLLVDGCERVELLDRFHPIRNRAREQSIYTEIINTYPSLKHHCNCIEPQDEYSFNRIFPHYGPDAAAERFFAKSPEHYDFIISRATLQHLTDPLLAIRDMARALVSGGTMIHKVDLRDLGMFSGQFHELKFLEIPSWLYRAMTRDTGRPNRVRIDRYRSVAQQAGLQARFVITRLAAVGDIKPHLPYEEIAPALREKSLAYVRVARNRFATCFSLTSDEDLSIGGFFMIATKPFP